MQDRPPKIIDAGPGDYRVEGEVVRRPREPIFGPGLPVFLAEIAGFLVVFLAVAYFRG